MDRTRRSHKWAADATWMRTDNRCVCPQNRRNAIANLDMNEMLIIKCVSKRKLRLEQNDRRRAYRTRYRSRTFVKDRMSMRVEWARHVTRTKKANCIAHRRHLRNVCAKKITNEIREPWSVNRRKRNDSENKLLVYHRLLYIDAEESIRGTWIIGADQSKTGAFLDYQRTSMSVVDKAKLILRKIFV